MHSKSIRLSAVVLACSVLPLLAQVNTGTILGTVQDPTGAAVVGADVTLKRIATNEIFKNITNAAGDYRVESLPVGEYQITVAMSGFKTETRKGVLLEVGRTLRTDFALTVGGVAETVQVDADVPLLNSDKSEFGHVMDQLKLSELPLIGRDFQTLATLNPGVTPVRGAANGSSTLGLNIRGNRRGDNVVYLDGGVYSSSDGTTTFIPNLDALQEFQVKTGLYGAEYGIRPGGQIIAVTKSGTNQFHGTVFDFLRNDNLDARNTFQSVKTEFKQNQFGGTIGGPIYIPGVLNGKDRAWFFFGYQQISNRGFRNFNVVVPTVDQKRGVFSVPITDPLTRQPFPNNTIPSNRIDSVSTKLLTFWPDPNRTGPLNFTSDSSASFDNPQIIARVDFKTSDVSRWWGRFIWDDSPLLGVSPFPIFSTTTQLSTWGADITNTRTFGSQAVNTVAVHFFRRPDTLGVLNPALNPVAATLGIKNLLEVPINSIGVPGISVQGLQGFGGGIDGKVNIGNWEVKDDLAIQKGDHSLKMGAEWKRDYTFFIIGLRGSFSFTPRYTGDPFADYLLGYASSTSQGGDLQRGNNAQNNWFFYFQDDWKVNPKLTLNLGLRWELPGAWKDKRGFATNFDLATGTFNPPLDPKPLGPFESGRFLADVPLIEWPRTGLLPRIGLAYRLMDRTVVRAGYGMYGNQPDLNTGIGALQQNPRPGTFGKTFLADPQVPNLFISDPFPTGGATAPAGVAEAAGSETPMPFTRSHSWGLSLQHQLGRDVAVEVGYQGSHTTNLIESVSVNDAPAGTTSAQPRRPFPEFGEITFGMGDGQAWYNGLEAKIEKRFGPEGLYFLGSFTWAKALDNVNSRLSGNILGTAGTYIRSRNFPVSENRALSESHIGQRLALTWGYELPFGKGKPFAATGAAAAILGGWSIQQITVLQDGFWFPASLQGDPLNTGSRWAQRPDLIQNPNLPDSQRTTAKWFDTAAFVTPSGLRYGNAGRAVIEAPGIINLDLAVHRRFALTESQALQFRFEAFNLTNHANYSLPGQNYGTPAFGVIGTALPPRQLQFALKYLF